MRRAKVNTKKPTKAGGIISLKTYLSRSIENRIIPVGRFFKVGYSGKIPL